MISIYVVIILSILVLFLLVKRKTTAPMPMPLTWYKSDFGVINSYGNVAKNGDKVAMWVSVID